MSCKSQLATILNLTIFSFYLDYEVQRSHYTYVSPWSHSSVYEVEMLRNPQKQSCNFSCPPLPSAELFGFLLLQTRFSLPPSVGLALSPLTIYSVLTSATSIISSALCSHDLPTSPHNILIGRWEKNISISKQSYRPLTKYSPRKYLLNLNSMCVHLSLLKAIEVWSWDNGGSASASLLHSKWEPRPKSKDWRFPFAQHGMWGRPLNLGLTTPALISLRYWEN